MPRTRDLLLDHLAHPLAKWLLAGAATAGFGPAGGLTVLAAGGLYEAVRHTLTDRMQARQAERLFEDLADSILEDIASALAGEGVSVEEIAACAAELAATLGAEDVLRLALEADLDATKLEAGLLAARPPGTIWPGEKRPQQLYRQLVQALTPRLVAVVRELPHYEAGRDREFLERLSDLGQRADAILGGVHEARTAARAAAERAGAAHDILKGERRRQQAARHRDEQAYRTALFEQVRWLRLFGLDEDPSLRSDLPLDLAYVPLRLELAGQERGLRLAFPEVLALLPAFGNRLLIEAPAGFGKTTLLQWLTRTRLHADTRERFPDPPAVLERLEAPFRSAERGHEAARTEDEEAPLRAYLRQLREALPADAVPWHERLPAFLRLRDLRDDPLWPVAEWPKRIVPQAAIETRDWWMAAVREGRAILLLDGVDEVLPDRRGRLRESIEGLIAAHPETMVVVTSRPGAVNDARWMRLFDGARITIEPMGPSEIETFVGHWHAALRQIARDRAPSEEEEHRLLRRILDRPGLRNLAQVPLLCAAICWLACIRRGELPDRMPELFEKLTEQLVHRLDAKRLGRDGLARLVPVLEGLDSTDRISLLARLAWFAVRERRATLDREPAEGQITEGLRDLGKAEGREAVAVLDALLERSGILRPAGADGIEFVHNALRGFLGARRFAGEEAVEDPIRAAIELDDQDLPVLAAARGTRGYREKLIRALLERAGRSRSDPATARRLRIAALRCAESGEITPDLREELRTLEQELLPPRDASEAAWFAELGARIVPHLGPREDFDDTIAAACVRCLALVGGDEARKQLDRWNTTEDRDFELAQALVDAFDNPLDVTFFRKNVLRQSDDLFLVQVVRERLGDRHLARLLDFGPHTALDLSGTRITDAGLEHLAGMTKLEQLFLGGTAVTDAGLGHLTGMTELKELDLSGTAVTDAGLVHLTGLTELERLNLSGTAVTDAGLVHLAGLTELELLLLNGTAVTDAGLEHLAGLPELLWFDPIDTAVSDAGMERFQELRRDAGLPEVRIHR